MKRVTPLFLALLGCSSPSPELEQPAEGHAVVCSYNPEARAAALEMLAVGGNAFDAFVAATFVEFVVGPGVTSIAGMLGAMLYDASTGQTHHLDSEFNVVLDPEGRWTEGSQPGKAAVVPGAVAGLEAISERFGRLSFADAVQPALRIARDGFKMNATYRGWITYRRDVLERTAYGRATFFGDGDPPEEGELFRQPELAELLAGIAEEGAAYMMEGPWAEACVATVREHGGKMTLADLARFEPIWHEPRRVRYRDYEVHAGGGRCYGGASQLLALKVLEHADLAALGHPSESPDALELLVRTVEQVALEPWLHEPAKLDDAEFMATRLAPEHAAELWRRVEAKTAAKRSVGSGHHSYQVIVVDEECNAISGVNSIGSLPWGEGLFVQGAALTGPEAAAYWFGPGERTIDPLSDLLIFKDGKLVGVLGTMAMSMLEAALQVAVNVMDYGLSGEEAATAPRFGTYQVDFATLSATSTSRMVDRAMPAATVEELGRRGIELASDGFVDVGSGCVVVMRPDGKLEAGILNACVDTVRPEGY